MLRVCRAAKQVRTYLPAFAAGCSHAPPPSRTCSHSAPGGRSTCGASPLRKITSRAIRRMPLCVQRSARHPYSPSLQTTLGRFLRPLLAHIATLGPFPSPLRAIKHSCAPTRKPKTRVNAKSVRISRRTLYKCLIDPPLTTTHSSLVLYSCRLQVPPQEASVQTTAPARWMGSLSSSTRERLTFGKRQAQARHHLSSKAGPFRAPLPSPRPSPPEQQRRRRGPAISAKVRRRPASLQRLRRHERLAPSGQDRRQHHQ